MKITSDALVLRCVCEFLRRHGLNILHKCARLSSFRHYIPMIYGQNAKRQIFNRHGRVFWTIWRVRRISSLLLEMLLCTCCSIHDVMDEKHFKLTVYIARKTQAAYSKFLAILYTKLIYK